jgi:hypothetical protein
MPSLFRSVPPSFCRSGSFIRRDKINEATADRALILRNTGLNPPSRFVPGYLDPYRSKIPASRAQYLSYDTLSQSRPR